MGLKLADSTILGNLQNWEVSGYPMKRATLP